MRVPRHLKHPIALWLIDGRAALDPPLKPLDIANRLGVDEATVRRWETARAGSTNNLPSPGNIEALERILGRPSPERVAPGLDAQIAAALAHQTALLEQLVEGQASRVSEQLVRYGGPPPRAKVVPAPTARKRRQHWLKLARQRHGWAPRDVDKALERPLGTYSPWESGDADPRGAEITNLARVLDIPRSWITNPPETDVERIARVHFDDGDAAAREEAV